MLEAIILKSRGKDMLCTIEYNSVENKGKKVVLYKHGFMGNKITPHRMIVNLSHQLIELGYTVVRFDCIGAGDSEGNYNYTTIDGEIEDTLVVDKYIMTHFAPQNYFMIGYSLGGAITALVSNKIKTDGIILWSPVSNLFHNFYHLLGKDNFIQGLEGNDIDFNGDRVSKHFFQNIKEFKYDPLKIIKEYQNPICIIHGTADNDVLSINSLAYNLASQNSKIYYVDEASHSYDTISQQDKLFEITINFLNNFN